VLIFLSNLVPSLKVPSLKKKLIIPALITALFALPANAELMKLKNAVEIAVTSNPEVLKIYNTYESTYADELAAFGSGFLPSIDYTASMYDENRSDPNTVVNGVAGVNKGYARYNRGVTIRQNLFNGFFDYNNVKRLSHAARGKVFELENTSSLIATDTTKAYVDLVRYRLLVSLAEDNYVSLKTLYEQLKLKSDAGVAKKSDLEQAQSRLSLADYNLTVEGANLHDMEAKYQRLVGDLPPKDLDNTIQINKDIPKDAITALTKAQQNNPALVASFEDIEQQANMRNTKVSAFLPRVDFKAFKDANINSNGVKNSDGSDGQFRNEGVGVDFTWNLFRGGADINSARKEQSLYEAALDNRDKICRDVREQLQVGYNDIKKYTEQVAYLDQRQIAIEKARDAYRKQFEINQRSLIDLLNAENELFEAKRAYLNASHDLAIAYARTHAQMGTILQALGISRYKSDKVPSPTDTKVDVGYASCPTAAPTPYAPDRRMLDQRANDAMVPVAANGNLNTPQDNNAVNANDKKKTPQKKLKQTKEKDLAPTVQPVTSNDTSTLPINLAKVTSSETAPKAQEIIQVANNEPNTGAVLSSPEKIKAFQKSQGIPVTGKINRTTRETLKRLKESNINANETNPEISNASESQLSNSSTNQSDAQKISKDETTSDEKVSLFGKLGNLVKSLTAPTKTETLNPKAPELAVSEPAKSVAYQQAKKLEPSSDAMEKITSASVFSDPDLSTPEKVKEFQKSQGIPVTGFVGDMTRKALKHIQQTAGNSPVSSIEEMSPPINIGSN
jgi:adhesin transport system outer membrane protein